jgi:hypothetical protein
MRVRVSRFVKSPVGRSVVSNGGKDRFIEVVQSKMGSSMGTDVSACSSIKNLA